MVRDVFFQAEHISAGYGKKEVIHDISFCLNPHTITGVLGANGSGKTTLIRCVINQLSHRGHCILKNERLEEKSARGLAREVSYIAQKSGLSISLPVLEVVLMGFNPVLRVLEQPSRCQRELAMDALAQLGIQEYAQRDFLTLSEGQKQLVLLARTMVEDSSLLVLDEPDSALDFQNRHMILKKIKEMMRKHEKATLLCLHDPTLALAFCNQLLLIKDGVCIQVLRPETDSVEDMENALKEIYGSVSLKEWLDRKGNRRLTLLWEDE